MIVLCFLLIGCSRITADAPPISPTSLGWDLSYQSLLAKNQVRSDEWLATWLTSHRKVPIEEVLRTWKDQPVVASALVEFAHPHARDFLAYWFLRTQDAAYYWVFLGGRSEGKSAVPFEPRLLDELLAAASLWRQRPPLPDNMSPNAAPGYFGFLSTYDHGTPRQILLTYEDLIAPRDPEWKQVERGRVMRMLEPIIGTVDVDDNDK
jgi:hypothetical protein